MNLDDFRAHAHELVDWMADYLENVRSYAVKSPNAPGTLTKQLPAHPPAKAEAFESILEDFERMIVPGMTHWQHPRFFAYFPANSSPPSVLAEMLTATLGAQCMSWQTSPAATELEEVVLGWLGEMIGLPSSFTGVIQDTASTATLCSILTAREQAGGFAVKQMGLRGSEPLAVYCSTETHSSIEKAVRIAGLGSDNLRKIPVDDNFALIPEKLEAAVADDLRAGIRPLCAVATIGTTGSTAVDPLRAIAEICRAHDIWLHVDAAYAGTALLLEEMRWMIDGIEMADTFVFNPHKWMFTNFDCSAYFVKDVSALVRTFEILPEYLKTAEGDRVNNYRDWGIQLGRRFRALKLWFVIRSYGVDGLRNMIRTHLELAEVIEDRITEASDFELLAARTVNLLCFRYRPAGISDESAIDAANERLLSELNSSGELYLTHTRLGGKFCLRLVTGQTQVNRSDIDEAWNQITETARRL
jgi:aromatic-L-amino-acid decarboxylase